MNSRYFFLNEEYISQLIKHKLSPSYVFSGNVGVNSFKDGVYSGFKLSNSDCYKTQYHETNLPMIPTSQYFNVFKVNLETILFAATKGVGAEPSLMLCA